MRAAAAVVAASLMAQVPKQPPGLLPKPTVRSDVTVKLELAGRMPTRTNPTSPFVAGSRLLLIDQGGYLYKWDGAQATPLITPKTLPAGVSLTGPEGLLNAAADSTGRKVYVAFISSSTPRGVSRLNSPHAESYAWYVLYEFAFDGDALTQPRSIIALQAREDGHTGGGLAVLRDGSVLLSIGDNGDSYEDGREYSQNPSVYLAKIVRVDPANGSARAVAVGVRAAQRLVIDDVGGEQWVEFVDPGGWVAEELNGITVSDLLSGPSPANFGWGRNADGKAREGTIYIDRLGNAEARIPAPEPGFREPLAEFGRDAQLPVAISGPVRSPQFSRIGFLFGDLVSGALYAITGPPTQTRQDVLEVNLVDAQSQPMNLKALAGGNRPDPRFFNFPDGTAGVLLERTGDFYRISELR